MDKFYPYLRIALKNAPKVAGFVRKAESSFGLGNTLSSILKHGDKIAGVIDEIMIDKSSIAKKIINKKEQTNE